MTMKTSDAPSSDGEANVEHSGNIAINPSPRSDLPAWRWFLTCVGLYVGALLYGMYLYSSIQLGHATELVKGLTPQLPLMFKGKSMKTWDILRTCNGLALDSQWHPLQ